MNFFCFMPFTDLSLTHCLAKATEFLQKRSNIANLTCLPLFTHSTNHHKLQINTPVYFSACFIGISHGNWFSADLVTWLGVPTSSGQKRFRFTD